MDEHRDLSEEVKVYSSGLSDPELTIDEATALRLLIDRNERTIEANEKQLLELADGAFFGYSQPGGLTLFFYGYTATPPSAYAPGCYHRKSG